MTNSGTHNEASVSRECTTQRTYSWQEKQETFSDSQHNVFFFGGGEWLVVEQIWLVKDTATKGRMLWRTMIMHNPK